MTTSPAEKRAEEKRAYDRAWQERNREHRNAWFRAWYANRTVRKPRPHQHRIESQRDLAAYLRKRGNLHMHWVRHGGNHGWVLIYESHSKHCGTERCVMIPLTITA